MSAALKLSTLVDKLVSSAASVGDPQFNLLLERLADYCQQESITDPYADILTTDRLGDLRAGMWDKQEARERVFRVLGDRRRKAEAAAAAAASTARPSTVWDDSSTEAFEAAATSVLSQSFIMSPLSDTARQVYMIDDADQRIVVPVLGSPQDVAAAVGRVVQPVIVQSGIATTAALVNSMLFSWKVAGQVTDTPPALHGKLGGDEWCLARASVWPNPDVDWSHIRLFTHRLNDPEAFAAWVWGVYSGENRGRQVPYIYDYDGEGGKSRFFQMLGKHLFGDRIYTAYPMATMAKDTHVSSVFAGQRFVVDGDCNNRYVLHSQAMKELSGDDKTILNPKYVQPYGTYLQARVAIGSNFPPYITRDRHSTSRLLYLILEPLGNTPRDPTLPAKWVMELPGFLHWAQQCYKERCPDNYAIQVNDAVRYATETQIRICETQYVDLFDKYFVEDPDGELTYREWSAVVKEEKMDKFRADDMLGWIRAVFDVNAQTNGKFRGWRLPGIRRRGGADNWRTPNSANGEAKETTDTAADPAAAYPDMEDHDAA